MGSFRVGTSAVVTLLVLFRLQFLPVEILIEDFLHIIRKDSVIPGDDSRSDVSPWLWEFLAPGREVGGILTLSIWVIVRSTWPAGSALAF